jgi:hypothetical protein
LFTSLSKCVPYVSRAAPGNVWEKEHTKYICYASIHLNLDPFLPVSTTKPKTLRQTIYTMISVEIHTLREQRVPFDQKVVFLTTFFF